MNKFLLSLLSSAFILTAPGFAQTPPPTEGPATATTAPSVAMKPAHHRDRFPELHRAMRKLRGAKQDLLRAAHDYAGHKAKAITDIDEALAELRAAIASDSDKK